MEGVTGHSHQESEHLITMQRGMVMYEHVWLSLRNTECLVARNLTELEQPRTRKCTTVSSKLVMHINRSCKHFDNPIAVYLRHQI